jgi:hypothetical protein
MKDKVLTLIDLLTENEIPKKPSMEDENPSLKDLLTKKAEALDAIGIKGLLSMWDQQNKSTGVGVVLGKRTMHHHRVSQLQYNEDILNLKFVDTMENPQIKSLLNEYGLERMNHIRKESTDRIFEDTLKKIQATIVEIEENLNALAVKLIEFYKLPVTEEKVMKIYEKSNQLHASFEVVNRTSLEKIPPIFREKIDKLIGGIISARGADILAVYLIGSLGRGEYGDDYTNVEFYVVTESGEELPPRLPELFSHSYEITRFSRENFLSVDSRKERFIAKSDGILFYGEDFVSKEKFPKPGLELAWLLSCNFLENLEEAEKWTTENPTADPEEIKVRSQSMAKEMMDFIYSVVVSNKPQFTHSASARIEKILEMYPNNLEPIKMLLAVAEHGVGDHENFSNLLVGFKPQALINFEKMRSVHDELERRAQAEKDKLEPKTTSS